MCAHICICTYINICKYLFSYYIVFDHNYYLRRVESEMILLYMHNFIGYLQCKRGWYGVDCSVPSALSSIREWPRWLRPANINVPDSTQTTETLFNLNAVVQKKRPLIYVYDLPPDFNSLLLEVRIPFHYFSIWIENI